MSQLEALATLKVPSIQLCNLTVTNSAQSAIFGPATGGQIARLRILNLHASNTIAITLSDVSVTAVPQVQTTSASNTTITPSYSGAAMVASTSAAIATGDGIRIQPGSTLEINLSTATRVWVIASAAATPVQIACILQNG